MSLLLLELALDRMLLPPLQLMTGVQPQLQVLQVSQCCCNSSVYLPIPAFIPFCAACSVSCPSAALAAHSLASKASQLILMYVVQMDGMQLLLLPLSRLSLLALTSLVPSTRCSAENSGLLTY